MLTKLTVILALGAATLAQPQNAAPQNADWTKPFPPFRIIGNIYWVGSYDLATYLITTPQGNILINTGVGDTAKQIKASNKKAVRQRVKFFTVSLLLPQRSRLRWFLTMGGA